MKLRDKQSDVFDRIDEVKHRQLRTGKHAYALGGQDVTTTVVSLIVKGYVTREHSGRVRTVSKHDLRFSTRGMRHCDSELNAAID